MKKSCFLIALAFVLALAARAHAIPTLQLDIGQGTYDYTTETIVTGSNDFTLYAYLIPDRYNLLTDTYYISAAITPRASSSGLSIGSFDINGATVRVTEDMTYGVPPIEDIVALQGWDSGDLPRHSIFPTYFYEFEVRFDELDQIAMYNTQDRAISGATINLSHNETGGMYYAAIHVNTQNITSSDYYLHFDLYNTKLRANGDVDVSQFAPFSHDAGSTSSVPEPGTLMLLGTGLAGLYLGGRASARRPRG